MTAKRIGKRFLKIAGLIVGSFIVLLTAFHFWFVYHAEEIIQDMVSIRSKGKIILEVKNFKFNWFSKKMALENAVFYSTDSSTSGTKYSFAVRKINLTVRAVFPMIFEDKVLINNLSLKDPDIVVTRLRRAEKNDPIPIEEVSIPREMGKIYKSIQDALTVLQVKKFEIEDATFTLYNRMKPEDLPLKVTNFDFHIDNLKVDTGRLTGKEKIFFSDNLVLKSRDQDIIFPDGRHRLSYRKFRINIEKRIVEFDSCTIAAIRTDSATTEFSIYFDELVMTNIDFGTLYRTELIKADSVYCINPRIKLDADMDKRVGPKKTPPKLDDILRQLTGDMAFNYVIVNNASFDIRTQRNGIPNSFVSNNNSFEMQGLRIDKEAERPLRVKKFDMAIRNYENFLRDSTYEMQFDSVHFSDDKILLSDFSFRKVNKGKTINSFKVPRFEMSGLSWDELLFEQKLIAKKATLYQPVIKYTEGNRIKTNRNRKLFDVLSDINEVILLDDLNIINGDIELNLNSGVKMNLEKATVSVESRSLLGSSRISGIRRSVNYLDFKKGELKINDIKVQLYDINYTGSNSHMRAGSAMIHNSSGTLSANAQGVEIDEVLLNENTGDVSIGGIRWQKADLKLGLIPLAKNEPGGSSVSLTDIAGKNTRVHYIMGKRSLTAQFDQIEAVAVLLNPGEEPIIGGLAFSGRDLSLSGHQERLNVNSFEVKDQDRAILKGINFFKETEQGRSDISLPMLSFNPDVQAMIGKQFLLGEIRLSKPVFTIQSYSSSQAALDPSALPVIKAKKIILEQPEILYSKGIGDQMVRLEWNGKTSADNSLVISDLGTEGSFINARELAFVINSFRYVGSNKKGFDAGEGKINGTIRDLQSEWEDGQLLNWKGTVSNLEGKDFVLDSVGKNAGRFSVNTMQLKELVINSSSLGNIRRMIKENQNFRLSHITGDYIDSDNKFKWYNAGYDKTNKIASLDSFSYSPTPPKEEYVASRPYQSDYLQIKTGAIKVGPFDIDSYLQDTIIKVGVARIDDVDFNDFRDNRPPFRAGIIKPLMVERIKSIPARLLVDTLIFNNANITYAELNPKTDQTGVILFNRTVIKAFPFRNFDFTATDSLRIHANGYLMDSIWVRLRLKQSYTDSLSGFLLTLRMKPTDMRVLNPILIPLASAKLRSGKLDTLNMRVAGGEYFAFGEMDMYYHDLIVQVYKKGLPQKRGLLTFFANTFIIKNQNKKKTSNVFFLRNRERSPINYLIKILMSGVNSSIGAKSNRKVMRQYKKELRQRNLPPLDYD